MPAQAIHFLLVAKFREFKMSAAISDIAEAHLDAGDLEGSRTAKDEYDRLALLVRLFLKKPQSLAYVRGLNAWHKKGTAPLILKETAPTPSEPLATFLVPEKIGPILATIPMHIAGAGGIHFEMVVPRGSDGHLVFLRRNLRPTHHWNEDGSDIDHGFEEELIVLHFHDGGKAVKITSVTSSLSRVVADLIASAYFGTEVHYADDFRKADEAAIENLLAAVTDPEGEIPLVEIVATNCPLKTAPDLILRRTTKKGDVIIALGEFEDQFGDVLTPDHLDDIARIKVRFKGNRFSLFFPMKGGVRVVQFDDGRIDNNKCGEFVAFLADRYHIEVRSTENKGGKQA